MQLLQLSFTQSCYGLWNHCKQWCFPGMKAPNPKIQITITNNYANVVIDSLNGLTSLTNI